MPAGKERRQLLSSVRGEDGRVERRFVNRDSLEDRLAAAEAREAARLERELLARPRGDWRAVPRTPSPERDDAYADSEAFWRGEEEDEGERRRGERRERPEVKTVIKKDPRLVEAERRVLEARRKVAEKAEAKRKAAAPFVPNDAALFAIAIPKKKKAKGEDGTPIDDEPYQRPTGKSIRTFDPAKAKPKRKPPVEPRPLVTRRKETTPAATTKTKAKAAPGKTDTPPGKAKPAPAPAKPKRPPLDFNSLF